MNIKDKRLVPGVLFRSGDSSCYFIWMLIAIQHKDCDHVCVTLLKMQVLDKLNEAENQLEFLNTEIDKFDMSWWDFL